jgi:hypothetical protein
MKCYVVLKRSYASRYFFLLATSETQVYNGQIKDIKDPPRMVKKTMSEQKDIQKTGINSYGHNNVSSVNELKNKPLYEFANKKTEKLVTALYMITDCMETDDALKGKLRMLGVELLSDMYKLPILSPVEKHAYITTALTRINEIVAFIEIAHTIGFVSEMNGNILKKEFNLLMGELNSYQAENQNTSFGGILFENQKNSSFALNEKMFHIDEKIPKISQVSSVQGSNIKDNKGGYEMSFRNKNLTTLSSQNKGPSKDIIANKKDRSEKILALIKDKKEVSIKDISIAFAECSEKTIQRELNSLVSKGQIKKVGAKRWSKYLVIG